MHSDGHKKHGGLKRPSLGTFGRNEWAFVGGRCSDINDLSGEIIKSLNEYKCVYVDQSHFDNSDELPVARKLKEGAMVDYDYNIFYHQLQFTSEFNPFQQRSFFSPADIVFINGNHFEASAQVVILDPAKKESLRKRLDRLTNIQLILCKEPGLSPADFLPGINMEGIPIYSLDDKLKINIFFRDQMLRRMPPLKGLVLAGGQSLRLGHDKTRIHWHGKEQRYYLADLLQQHCTETYISCRPDQAPDLDPAYNALPDSFLGLGPYGALLSAFRTDPDAAWLVLAADLPLLNPSSIAQLVNSRRQVAPATAFTSPRDGSPEPLAAIWEPRSYPLLLTFLSQGISCPRKVLMNTQPYLINAQDPSILTNVNTPQDEASAESIIKKVNNNNF